MAESEDILKKRSLTNGQVIGLCFFLCSWAISATVAVVAFQNIQQNLTNKMQLQETKDAAQDARIEYVNGRIDRKFKQVTE